MFNLQIYLAICILVLLLDILMLVFGVCIAILEFMGSYIGLPVVRLSINLLLLHLSETWNLYQ